MTRSFVKDISSRLKAAFSADVFKKKPKVESRKVRTPPTYYRSKEVQQEHGKLGPTPGARNYSKRTTTKVPKQLKSKKR